MTNFNHHDALGEISKGDELARQFCIVAFEFFHLVDDLFDKQDRTANDVTVVLCAFIETIASNPFFQANKAQLLPVMRSGAIAWAGSESLKTRGGLTEKLAAEVLKSWYQELFYAVAAIVGGVPHALVCAEKFRGYDFG